VALRRVAELEAALSSMTTELKTVRAERDKLRRAYDQLKAHLELLRRRIFVAKAERIDTSQLEMEFAETTAKFRRFLDDGRLRLENNNAERALRSSIAVGRKAWLFFGSDDHAQSAANLFSLIASCLLHDLDSELRTRAGQRAGVDAVVGFRRGKKLGRAPAHRAGHSLATMTKPRSISWVDAFGLTILKCCP
jgi:hypothetical protein